MICEIVCVRCFGVMVFGVMVFVVVVYVVVILYEGGV